MTTDRELMQQALDLLDDINQCSLPPTGIPLPAEIDHVMEALRARLAQPEPEAIMWLRVDEDGDVAGFHWTFPLPQGEYSVYPVPYQPQREWVGLTPEEAREISLANRPYVVDMIAALEARLKEKNT